MASKHAVLTQRAAKLQSELDAASKALEIAEQELSVARVNKAKACTDMEREYGLGAAPHTSTPPGSAPGTPTEEELALTAVVCDVRGWITELESPGSVDTAYAKYVKGCEEEGANRNPWGTGSSFGCGPRLVP